MKSQKASVDGTGGRPRRTLSDKKGPVHTDSSELEELSSEKSSSEESFDFAEVGKKHCIWHGSYQTKIIGFTKPGQKPSKLDIHCRESEQGQKNKN